MRAGFPVARHATLILLASLGACAEEQDRVPSPAVPVASGNCSADPVQRFVGTTVSAGRGAEMLAASGARQLRWAPPRTALTMDYRADRLTVSYDDAMAVTRVACG